jgi:hypothetical protein
MSRKARTVGKRRIVRRMSRKENLKRSPVYLSGSRKCVHVKREVRRAVFASTGRP